MTAYFWFLVFMLTGMFMVAAALIASSAWRAFRRHAPRPSSHIDRDAGAGNGSKDASGGSR